jgi:hypothetical protein
MAAVVPTSSREILPKRTKSAYLRHAHSRLNEALLNVRLLHFGEFLLHRVQAFHLKAQVIVHGLNGARLGEWLPHNEVQPNAVAKQPATTVPASCY